MASATRLAILASLLVVPIIVAPAVGATEPEPAPDTQGSQEPAASDGARHLHAKAAPGEEVLVRTHHNWSRGCQPEHAPKVTILRQPKSGSVEARLGDFVVTKSLSGNMVCFDKTLPGIGIYYKAAAAGGADSFRYLVEIGGIRRNSTLTPLEYEVEIAAK